MSKVGSLKKPVFAGSVVSKLEAAMSLAEAQSTAGGVPVKGGTALIESLLKKHI